MDEYFIDCFHQTAAGTIMCTLLCIHKKIGNNLIGNSLEEISSSKTLQRDSYCKAFATWMKSELQGWGGAQKGMSHLQGKGRVRPAQSGLSSRLADACEPSQCSYSTCTHSPTSSTGIQGMGLGRNIPSDTAFTKTLMIL